MGKKEKEGGLKEITSQTATVLTKSGASYLELAAFSPQHLLLAAGFKGLKEDLLFCS